MKTAPEGTSPHVARADMSIEFWFDFVSPYAYLGSTQIEAVAGRHGRAVNWRPVLIGVTVLKVMGMRPLLEYPLKGEYLRRDAPRSCLACRSGTTASRA